jgi:type VI secretion system protein VasG
MLFPHVDASTIAAFVSDWTGPPSARSHDEITAVLQMEERLRERVGGRITPSDIARSCGRPARLEEPGAADGVFPLLGPSGVGKTELALAVSDCSWRRFVHDQQQHVWFMESHTVSQLKGSPPVTRATQGGVLTEAVRQHPIRGLLDEVERPTRRDELFYHVFDKARADGEGRVIDFRNNGHRPDSNLGMGDAIQGMCESATWT